MPDLSPLQGGILVEEPYSTAAYDSPAPATAAPPRRFLDLAYRASLPDLQYGTTAMTGGHGSTESIHTFLQQFDTGKVAARGTLQRRKGRREADSGCEQWETGVEDGVGPGQDTEQLLTNLTASFDQKMRLLLDPHYQSSGQISAAHTAAPPARKVELRRAGRVNKSVEPERRLVVARRGEGNAAGQALRQLNRSDSSSLSQQQLQIPPRSVATAEKENTVSLLREQFERIGREPGSPGSTAGPVAKSARLETVSKLRRKLSECRTRRVLRRHTVGGTKDFSEGVVSLIVRGVSAWDRLAPGPGHRPSLQLDQENERRLSLPPAQS